MTVQAEIESKLAEALPLQHLEVINESDQHNVPPGSESHFKVVLVSDEFEPLREVARHQHIYKILADEVSNKIHALALHTYTPVEWQARHGSAPMSPPCLGGSKHEKS